MQPLESRTMLAGDLLISEFLADNNQNLTDGFGESPGWIEVHNPAPAAKNLAGIYLTDNPEIGRAHV